MEKIEGIPDGWRLVRIGTPLRKEWFLDSDTKPTMANFDFSRCCMAIVERTEPPKPTYRPFANAAEFEPHRDRWVKRSDPSDSRDTYPTGCFRVIAYNDHHIWTSIGSCTSYEKMFLDGKTFEDGTPFGVKVSDG